MKANKFFAYLCGAMLLAGAMTSCVEDEENYVPAEPVAEDCMEVYFSAENIASAEFSSSEVDYAQVVIPVTVCRTYAADAAVVPIVVKQNSDIFNAPETVEFAAGETETTFEITLNNGEGGMHRLDLTIEDPLYANPYKALDGKPVYSFILDIYRWVKVCDAEVVNDYFTYPRPTTLEQKEGSSSYRLTSLYAEGCHFYFDVNGESYTIPEAYVLGTVTLGGTPCTVFDTGMRSGAVQLWGAVDTNPKYSYFEEGEEMNISLVYLTSQMQIVGGSWFDVTIAFK